MHPLTGLQRRGKGVSHMLVVYVTALNLEMLGLTRRPSKESKLTRNKPASQQLFTSFFYTEENQKRRIFFLQNMVTGYLVFSFRLAISTKLITYLYVPKEESNLLPACTLKLHQYYLYPDILSFLICLVHPLVGSVKPLSLGISNLSKIVSAIFFNSLSTVLRGTRGLPFIST